MFDAPATPATPTASHRGRSRRRDLNWLCAGWLASEAEYGTKNIQHTVQYTEMAPDRFMDSWRD